MGFSTTLSNAELANVHLNQLGYVHGSLPFLGFSRRSTTSPAFLVRASRGGGSKKSNRSSSKAPTKKKESPWDDANTETKITTTRNSSSRRRPSSSKAKKEHTPSAQSSRRTRPNASHIFVSAILPVEIEKVLQTEEPSSTPSWQTFASSLCGVWRGVGAAFTPGTAEMEAIALGGKDEMLYDCRILSTVEEEQEMSTSRIQRKTVWAVGNPLGEQGRGRVQVQGLFSDEDTDNEEAEGLSMEELGPNGSADIFLEEIDIGTQSESTSNKRVTADLEDQIGLIYDTVMEEDVLELEPGLVYFEDGSYSRGPLELLSGEFNDVSWPTFKIEQCLVRGDHCRLRLVHTIGVEGEGEEIQLLRVAVYNEEWMGPSKMKSISDSGGHHLKLFSQASRLQPGDLVGTWKVFEVSATAVLPDGVEVKQSRERPPYVYISMETQKRRLLPDLPVRFVEEEFMDSQDATVMWLPGGISAYVDVKDGGILTIGVGWYSDGVNLVMERDYNTEGNLCEVHSKTEVKGGWVGGRM